MLRELKQNFAACPSVISFKSIRCIVEGIIVMRNTCNNEMRIDLNLSVRNNWQNELNVTFSLEMQKCKK